MRSRSDVFRGVMQTWGRILTGRRPNLSIEITRECPLRCPGCYAFGDEHLGGDVTLRTLSDYNGDELVSRFMRLIDSRNPLHVSIVGGEPLVRYRELERHPSAHWRSATSTRSSSPAPCGPSREWADIRRLQIVVSIDGLQPEHDVRRTPATYDRILKHIAGHQITVHCTVTRQQVRREGYLEEFLRFWQANADTRMIWISLYTPQIGRALGRAPHAGGSPTGDRRARRLRPTYPKLEMLDGALKALCPAAGSPRNACSRKRRSVCLVRSRETDHAVPVRWKPRLRKLRMHRVRRFEAIARHRLPGGIRVGHVFNASLAAGNVIARFRQSAVEKRSVALTQTMSRS